jgi:hypothetical protein
LGRGDTECWVNESQRRAAGAGAGNSTAAAATELKKEWKWGRWLGRGTPLGPRKQLLGGPVCPPA